ncbi:MAG: ABC transporter permease [Rhodospirillaceae bacterium]|nr:ABC transporter permease [Rhodospirillaceae bacterium]
MDAFGARTDGLAGRRRRPFLIRSAANAALAEAILIPIAAVGVAFVLFGLFLAVVGSPPLEVFSSIYRGAFGTWFSWQNTLVRAAPLMLVALCTTIPAQLGLVVIGGDGAVLLGGLMAALCGLVLAGAPAAVGLAVMAACAAVVGAGWIGLVGALRHYRGVNETISSLLFTYLAVSVFRHLVQGPLRDPETQNYPGTYPIDPAFAIGEIPSTNIHWGLAAGIVACIAIWIVIKRTPFGQAMRVVGGNPRAARIAGLPVGLLTVAACALGGAFAGLAGFFEVSAVIGRANSALYAHYGLSAVLVSFVARHNAAAVIPAAIAVGGIRAAGGLVQRAHGLPDATVMVFEGIVFLVVLWSASWYGRTPLSRMAADGK